MGAVIALPSPSYLLVGVLACMFRFLFCQSFIVFETV